MSTYYTVYADEDVHEKKIRENDYHCNEDGEVTITIDVKDIPEGTEKLIFKVW